MPQIKTRQPALATFEICCSINIIDVNRIDMDRKVDAQMSRWKAACWLNCFWQLRAGKGTSPQVIGRRNSQISWNCGFLQFQQQKRGPEAVTVEHFGTSIDRHVSKKLFSPLHLFSLYLKNPSISPVICFSATLNVYSTIVLLTFLCPSLFIINIVHSKYFAVFDWLKSS